MKSIVQQIRSSDNLTDLFTKVLPQTTFKKLVHQIGMRQLKDLQNEILRYLIQVVIKENIVMILYFFFLRPDLIPLGFTSKVFNEATLTIIKVVVIQEGVL